MNQDKPLFVLPVLTRDDGGFLLLLAAVTLFLLGPIVTGGLPLDEDSLLFYYPLRVLHSDPAVGLWNPYQFCGFPRDGNPQSQLLYFPNLLLQFLPLSLGFRLLLVGHYLLGGVLFFLLLRGAVLRPVSAFFGALLFITGTFWRCKIVNLGLLEGIAWMPGVLFFFLIGLEHRFWIAYLCAALFFAMVMLAGMPHPALYGLLLLVLITFSLWWRRGCTLTQGLAALVLTVGSAMCLAAGMILPAWLYLGETMRGPLSLEEALAGALPWQDLWKVFLGGLSQPRIMRLEPWEGTCAIGATGLFFTLWGWRAIPGRLRLGLVLASLFACLSALGAQGGLATLLYHYLPGWDRLNMPNRALMLCALVLPIFGAYGLNWWLYQRQKTRLQAHILAALGGLALAGYAVAAGVNTWVWKTTLNPGLTSEVFLESISSSEWALYSNLLWLGLSLVLLALLDRFRWCLWLLFGLVLLQSCQFNARLYLETTDSSFYTKPKTVAQIQSFLQYKPYDRVMSYEPSIDFENDVRVWHIKPAVVPRFSEIYALSEIQGYDPLFPRRYAELVRAWAGQAEDSDARRRIRLTQLPRRMLDLLGIRYVIGHANSQFVYKGEGKLGEPGTYRIPCPSENAVQSFAIRWLMRDAVHLPQGETVAQLHCKKDGVTVETFPVRMGIEIANFVINVPDQPASHKPASTYRWLPGHGEEGMIKIRQYRAEFSLSHPARIDAIEIEKISPAGVMVVFEVNAFTTDTHGLELVTYDSELPVYCNPTASTPVYFTRLVKEYDKVEEMIDEFNHLDPQGEIPVFVQNDQSFKLGGPPVIPPKEEAHMLNYKRVSSDQFQIITQSDYDGVLVVQENYSPYWKAEVDGKFVEVIRLNHAFMGVHVTSGKQTILFTYRPSPFYMGCSITGSVLIGILLILGLCPKSRWLDCMEQH